MFPSIYFRISRDLTRVLYFFVSIFLCFPRRRTRSTLSALRLSKLSRRHETRLSRRSQILPFCFFFSRAAGNMVFLDKSYQKGTPLAVIRGQFCNPRTFVRPSLVHVVSCPYNSRFIACFSIHTFAL